MNITQVTIAKKKGKVMHAIRKSNKYPFFLSCLIPACQLLQREREAREARLLDREIRAQERHYQAESKKQKEAADRLQSQIHTQLSQVQKVAACDRTSSTPILPTKSPRDSVERVLLTDGKIRAQSEEKEKVNVKISAYQNLLSGTIDTSGKEDTSATKVLSITIVD